MRDITRFAVWFTFHPTLWFNRAMAALGFWKQWNWIDEHVLLGALPSRSDVVKLAKLGIGAFVNTCEEFTGHTRQMTEHGIVQLHVPTMDYHSPSREAVQRSVKFIREQIARGNKVYVHCKAGRGRSATVAVAYMMAAHRLTAREAYERIKAARPQVNSRIHQRSVIVEMERTLDESPADDDVPMRVVSARSA